MHLSLKELARLQKIDSVSLRLSRTSAWIANHSFVQMNKKKHKQTHNQAVKPQSAKGKPDAEYLNYKVIAKEGVSTMILSSGLSKCNAKSLENTLNSYINNKHSNIPGAGKTSVKFITIH